MRNVDEVFTPSDVASSYSFIQREGVKDIVDDLIRRRGCRGLLYGPAHCGKSSALIRYVGALYPRVAHIQCDRDTTSCQIARESLVKLRAMSVAETESGAELATESQLSLQFGQIGGGTNERRATNKSTKQVPVAGSREDILTLFQYMSENRSAVVLDNAQLLRRRVQRNLLEQLKSFSPTDSSAETSQVYPPSTIVFGATTYSPNRLLLYRWADGKVSAEWCNYLTIEQTVDLVRQGFSRLNLNLEPPHESLIANFADRCAGACHDICRSICLANSVRFTQTRQRTILKEEIDAGIKSHFTRLAEKVEQNRFLWHIRYSTPSPLYLSMLAAIALSPSFSADVTTIMHYVRCCVPNVSRPEVVRKLRQMEGPLGGAILASIPSTPGNRWFRLYDSYASGAMYRFTDPAYRAFVLARTFDSGGSLIFDISRHNRLELAYQHWRRSQYLKLINGQQFPSVLLRIVEMFRQHWGF